MSRISELTTLAENDLAVTDMIPILDVSAGTTKKVPVQTIRGNTLNANPTADIKSLCTSDYTIYAANARMLAGQIARVHVEINGGSTGISYGGTSKNIVTLPSAIFGILLKPITITVRSEQYPTAANWITCGHCFILDPTGAAAKITTGMPAQNVQTLHGLPASFVTSSGYFKALCIDCLAVVKLGAMLPYSS